MIRIAIRDVIVIGAGPAGSCAARVLAQGGCRVLLLDKAEFPREKPCGGLLSGKALAALGIPVPPGHILGPVNGMRLVAPDGRCFDSTHLAHRAALVERSRFDSWLIGQAVAAGVEFRPDTEVQGVVAGQEAVTVYTATGALVTRWVVAADGANSTAAHTSGIRKRWAPWQIGVTLSREWRGDEFPADPRGFIELHGVNLTGAFGWLFTWPGGWRLGIGAPAFFRPRLLPALEALQTRVRTKRTDGNLLPTKTSGGVVPAAVLRPCLGKGRILLVGDAAGLSDPFSGEGIDVAIVSGGMAANSILADTGKAVAEYQRGWYGEYLADRRLSLLLSLGCWKKGHVFWENLTAHPDWVDRLAGWMDGCNGYGTLLHQLVRSCLVTRPWRSRGMAASGQAASERD